MVALVFVMAFGTGGYAQTPSGSGDNKMDKGMMDKDKKMGRGKMKEKKDDKTMDKKDDKTMDKKDDKTMDKKQ
jgi:hypothetical protein